MEANPYRTPETDGGLGWGKPAEGQERGRPVWLGRCRFNLKLPFLLSAAMISGGQTARGIVSFETASRGGVPVSLSTFGEVFFFTLGCFAALAAILAIWKAPSLLRIRSPWRRRSNFRRSLVVLVAAMAIGSIAAGVAVAASALLFFTMPRELFDLLYESVTPH